MAYEIEDAFKAIEDELIDSMIRNMKHHRAEELREGFEWTSWQTLQLNALREYSANNRKKFTKQFADINAKIEEGIRQSRLTGNMDAEIEILEAIKKGFKASKIAPGLQAEFFRVNDRKLDALIEATKKDMATAERAMLRMADDQYRQVIFNAQVYANTGAGTYEKAVDMATKDYLSRGINCIQYKNGARVNIASYAAMAIKTADTRAYLTGEGEKRQEWGISTVIVNKRGHACLRCLKWTGRVLIDDVWSGGKKEDGDYPLMSFAMEQGLYHPNCKDIHTTFFPGITEEPKPLTRQEVEESKADYMREQEINYANRQKDKFKRLADGALDPDDKAKYMKKAKEWRERVRALEKSAENDIIKLKINSPIKQRNTGKGNPNAILQFDVNLNNRQNKILSALPNFDSRITVKKKEVKMSDLAALTAKTGDEFALFTRGSERLIIRGDAHSVNVDVEMAREMAKQGYKFTGHTHPGIDSFCLTASDGDYEILEAFNQKTSVTYNSKGDYMTYGE
ncbi:MAG: phage minor capsid protein [Lachnospiraceae bacterium]|nr:phage minor capsid protein [Lachnospiraceae bacterium]